MSQPCTLTPLPPTGGNPSQEDSCGCSWVISRPGLAGRCSLLALLPPVTLDSMAMFSSIFTPKSCQEFSQVQCTHLSINCKSQYPPSLSHPPFLLQSLPGEEGKSPIFFFSQSFILYLTTLHLFSVLETILDKDQKVKNLSKKNTPVRPGINPPFLKKKR